MHGRPAAKLLGVVCKSEREKFIQMLKMAEPHVVVSLLSNRTAIRGHALLVSQLSSILLGSLPEKLRCYVYRLSMSEYLKTIIFCKLL